MDDPFTHRCQPLDDAEAELRVVALIKAMRPYLPSTPLPVGRPDVRAPRRKVPLWPAQSLAARIPSQRSKTAAAQEDRLNLLPGYRPRRTDINNSRGGRA